MQRSADYARLFANVLHNVYFAALGPADGADVFAEHPEGGPHSLPRGNLDAGFEAAVGLAEEALCFQASGGVIARHAIWTGVGFFLRSYDEVSSLDLSVLGASRVVLKFV